MGEDKRLCPVCGVNELPPRYRKCDDCLTGSRAIAEREIRKEVGVIETVTTFDENDFRIVSHNRDVVLSCGHVVTTRRAVGEPAKCPLHKQMRNVVRVHDGEEVPEVEPIAAAAGWSPARHKAAAR